MNKGAGGKEKVQNQKNHMPIKSFLNKIKTTFLCQNFLKKRADYPPQKGTAETSFIEGECLQGELKNMQIPMKIELASSNDSKNKYPEYGKDGNLFTLEVEDGKVVVVGSRGGRTRLFKADGRDT